MNANYSPELDNIKIFFSPAKSIRRMENIISRDGQTAAIVEDVFKPVREAWAAAVFLLGYSQLTNKQYWLRENPQKNEAPDIFAISPVAPLQNEMGVKREILEIEVCDYGEHSGVGVVEHIKAKLKGKAYNKFTFLLCYVHKNGSIRLIDIINGLKGIKTSVREIWLLFHPGGGVGGGFVITRVYLNDPSVGIPLRYEGNYSSLSKIPQQEMIQTFRGSGRRVEFTHLGMAYVPLPRLNK